MLLQSLEGLKGKPRHQAGSMSPIGMSDYLKQAAASFDAPQDASAFLTIDGKGPAVQAQPRQVSRQGHNRCNQLLCTALCSVSSVVDIVLGPSRQGCDTSTKLSDVGSKAAVHSAI